MKDNSVRNIERENIMPTESTESVLYDVARERDRQEDLKRQGKFPWSCNDDFNPDTGKLIPHAEKLTVLLEEVGEAASIVCKLMANREEAKYVNLAMLKKELIQIAAVAVAWAESI